MVIIVMGVVGAGKTTIGRLLAAELQWHFTDADDFHPPANIEKISQGIPLSDADRAPWLDQIRAAIIAWNGEHRNVVLACSALKQSYRDTLRVSTDVEFVYLKGSHDLIERRLSGRHGHFASVQLLASQFSALEEPDDAITVNIDRPPAEIVSQIRVSLGLA
ncbi:MAG TPA: gluconokinase [Terriglobales bacterium]|jgi:gluconokinase